MRRVTSLFLITVIVTGSMSAFISDHAYVYDCCKQEMDCCVDNSQMDSCVILDWEEVSSPTLIASGPKPPKYRQDTITQISSLNVILQGEEDLVFLHRFIQGNPKVPLYFQHSTLLI